MIQSTTEYHKFILRPDNRARDRFADGIDPSHVDRLVQAISEKNMLDCHPILINSHMEVIDGQHRLKAAEQLGVPIYYIQSHDIDSSDLVGVNNIRKEWKNEDYLHYWCMQGNQNYIELKNFVDRYKIPTFLGLIIGGGDYKRKFNTGKMVFDPKISALLLQHCFQTLNILHAEHGRQQHFYSRKFWKSLIRLVQHENFDMERWRRNIKMNPRYFGNKATEEEMYKDFVKAYNYKCRNNLIKGK